METNRLSTALVTAVAPVAWGSTYIVTESFLPPDRPLFAATVRALPAGLVLLAWRRRLPHGDWWWRSIVLGLTNIGLFFPLIFLAAYHLPGGLAATLQATSPLAVMAIALPLLGERAALVRVAAAVVGLVGVTLLVLRDPGGVDVLGLIGAFGSVLVSALGFVLVKKWQAPVDMLTLVSWQLVVGGLALLPVGLLVEGAPPALDLRAVLGFVWLGGVGTALAYVCWFRGLRLMAAGAVSLIGLVNPVVGTVLGVVFASEAFGPVQALGMVLVLGGVVAGQLFGDRRNTRRRTGYCTDMATVPTLPLNDGRSIPQLGFGVFQVPPEDTAEITGKALEVGYRHIDTAEMYGNEKGVGEAIAASGIPRDELFVTSKLNNTFHEPDEARKAFERTLSELGLDQVDLFLIHWPLPTRYDGDYVSTWKTLEEFKADGRARSIGVSNFQPDHLARLAKESEVTPAVNQIEVHPYFTNEAARGASRDAGILVEAWSPIAQGGVLEDDTIAKIASDLGRTPAQVTLRWHVQRGDIIFPKSSSTERMEENFALFDFELDDDQVAAISALDKGEDGRTGPNPDEFDYIPD